MKGGSYSRGGGFTRQGVKHRKAPVNEVFFSKFFIIIRIPRVIWRGIRNYLSYFSGHWERIQSPVPVTPMDVRMCVGALGNLVSFSRSYRCPTDSCRIPGIPVGFRGFRRNTNWQRALPILLFLFYLIPELIPECSPEWTGKECHRNTISGMVFNL